MGRPKRRNGPPTDATPDEIREWYHREQLRRQQREAHGWEPRGDRQRAEEVAAMEEAERAEVFAARAAVAGERLGQPGGVEELLECYDDDPIMKAILAGEITDPTAAREWLRAAGWPTDDRPA